MVKKTVLILLLLVMLPFGMAKGIEVVAITKEKTGGVVTVAEEKPVDLESIVGLYNQTVRPITQSLTDYVLVFIGNQIANIRVNGDVYGIVIKGGEIVESKEGGFSNPTMNVNTNKATVRRIKESENPTVAFISALKTEDISYKSVGFFNKLKFGFGRLILKFIKIEVISSEEYAKPAIQQVVKVEPEPKPIEQPQLKLKTTVLTPYAISSASCVAHPPYNKRFNIDLSVISRKPLPEGEEITFRADFSEGPAKVGVRHRCSNWDFGDGDVVYIEQVAGTHADYVDVTRVFQTGTYTISVEGRGRSVITKEPPGSNIFKIFRKKASTTVSVS